MIRDFPHIRHLDQVRAAIEGREEFIVAEREWGFVANYLVNFVDTFPVADTKDPELNTRYLIRRECRGIKFDLNGNILARPFHKFFNLGERPETEARRIDFDESFVILDKLDGSMIHPILIDRQVVFCTKMGITDIAKPVQIFAENHPDINYMDFCYEMLTAGNTPIFEWCSRKQRIVVDYPNDQLVLTAIRHMKNGLYHSVVGMRSCAVQHNVPIVGQWQGSFDGINDFIQEAQALEDEEGYVIRFTNDGFMLKVKNLWYVQLHKTKEQLSLSKNVIALILNNQVDDITPHLEQADADRLNTFANDLHLAINKTAERLKWIVIAANDNLNGSKKRFAIEIVNNHEPKIERGLLFKIWDGDDSQQTVIKYIQNNLGTQTKLDAISSLIEDLDWREY